MEFKFSDLQPICDWVQSHWLTIVLTGEIIGAVIAVKTGHYKKCAWWLFASVATIWVGAY